MLARDVLINALAGLPADIDVIPYARNIAYPLRTTVMVRTDKVSPAGAGGSWDVESALVIIAAKVDPTGPADDELDAALQDVLYLLDTDDRAAGLLWTGATRAVYGEPEPTNPAYEVAVITRIQKEA